MNVSKNNSRLRRWYSIFRVGFIPLLILSAGSVWGLTDLELYLRGGVSSARDTYRIQVRNNIAYVASDANGLQIYNVTNPANPVRIGAYTNTDAAVLDVALGNNPTVNYAFLALGGNGIDVINISNPSNPQFVTNISEDVDFLSVNSLLVSPNDGKYLYIADDFAGVKIYRVTNPAGTVLGNFDPTNLVGEVGTYGTTYDLAINPGNFGILYVADGEGGVTRLNVQSPSNPVEAGNGETDGDVFGVAANSTGTTVFAAVDEVGLQTLDGTTMVKRKKFATGGSPKAVSFANSRVYLACGDGGVVVVDVSTAKPTRVGGYFTTNEALGVTLSGTNLFVAAGGMLILGTNLIANPQAYGTFITTNEFEELSDVLAVGIYGTNAIVADNNLGVQLVTVANPANPRLLSVIVPPESSSLTPVDIHIAGNYAYLAQETDGLEIWNLTNFVEGVFESTFVLPTPGPAKAVVVSGNYAYVACGAAGLAVADISDPYFPSVIGTYNSGGTAGGLAYSNGLVYLANGSQGLTIVDVNNPNNPLGIGSVTNGGAANAVALSGGFAFIAAGGTALAVVNITDPFHPIFVTALNLGDSAEGIAIQGDYAYVTDTLGGLLVFDISRPSSPRRVGGNSSFLAPHGLTIYSNRVYVAAGPSGMPILNLFQPIKFRNTTRIITNTVHVFVSGPTNGQVVRVQRSTNIFNPNGWVDWQTMTFPNSNFLELVDTNYPANLRRFYRGTSP